MHKWLQNMHLSVRAAFWDLMFGYFFVWPSGYFFLCKPGNPDVAQKASLFNNWYKNNQSFSAVFWPFCQSLINIYIFLNSNKIPTVYLKYACYKNYSIWVSSNKWTFIIIFHDCILAGWNIQFFKYMCSELLWTDNWGDILQPQLHIVVFCNVFQTVHPNFA